ncbi:MAG: acylphosphatase [Actinobacteria bacterium]|jgi:acylphosphatase|nr:acylphosphatase [Actinomycetota bacterium]MCL6094663.1 acylphosphatase [Actinomycetota bacterium]
MVRRHLFISGKVQGVFFRASLQELAEKAGVSGWARNTPDGRVEAVLEGEEDAVNALISWCKVGPPRAEVKNVEMEEEEPEGEGGHFAIR